MRCGTAPLPGAAEVGRNLRVGQVEIEPHDQCSFLLAGQLVQELPHRVGFADPVSGRCSLIGALVQEPMGVGREFGGGPPPPPTEVLPEQDLLDVSIGSVRCLHALPGTVNLSQRGLYEVFGCLSVPAQQVCDPREGRRVGMNECLKVVHLRLLTGKTLRQA